MFAIIFRITNYIRALVRSAIEWILGRLDGRPFAVWEKVDKSTYYLREKEGNKLIMSTHMIGDKLWFFTEEELWTKDDDSTRVIIRIAGKYQAEN